MKQYRQNLKIAATKLYDKGYSIIPLQYATKEPVAGFTGWSKYSYEQPDKDLAKTWFSKDVGIGLVLGESSGVIGLDFDYDVDNCHKEIEEMIFYCSPAVRKMGNKGFTQFFRYTGEKTRRWSKNGKVILELLSNKRYTVMPPSVHPENNKSYGIGLYDDLQDRESYELPELPKDFIKSMDKMFCNKITKKIKYKGKKNKVKYKQVKKALRYIDNKNEGVDYDTWIEIGMAIKSELGEVGLRLWGKWSIQSNKYVAESISYKWKSFTGGDISIGTLLYHAAEGGYKNKMKKKSKSKNKIVSITDLDKKLRKELGKGTYKGVPIGIKNWETGLHFRKKRVSVFTGYAGSGKSEFVDSVVLNLAKSKEKWKFLYVSLEKNPIGHYRSLIHKITGVSAKKRKIEQYEEAIKFIKKHIQMMDTEGEIVSMDAIYTATKSAKNKIDCLVIDPFNFIDSKGEILYNHVISVLRICSKMAKKFNIHVILVAHPRQPDSTFTTDKKKSLPKITIYSISGGASFANIADNIISITRNKDNTATVEKLKVREQEIDELGSVRLKFNKKSKEYSFIKSMEE